MADSVPELLEEMGMEGEANEVRLLVKCDKAGELIADLYQFLGAVSMSLRKESVQGYSDDDLCGLMDRCTETMEILDNRS